MTYIMSYMSSDIYSHVCHDVRSGKKHVTGTTMTVDLRYCELQYVEPGTGKSQNNYVIIFWSFFGHRT